MPLVCNGHGMVVLIDIKGRTLGELPNSYVRATRRALTGWRDAPSLPCDIEPSDLRPPLFLVLLNGRERSAA